MEVEEARQLAESLLAESLPRRWAHSQGVAACARSLSSLLGDDAGLVEASAWLHDIGYAPTLVVTGFHPLDGARYLRQHGVQDRRLVTLVAHHSCAVIEADVRGHLDELLAEFPAAEGTVKELLDALTYCDMTTDPGGQPTTVDERLGEILQRYPVEDPVHRAISAASPEITGTAERVVARLSAVRRG